MRENTNLNLVIVIMLALFGSSVNADIWVNPESFDVTLLEGTTLTDTLTIGNNGSGNLNFTLRSRQVSGGTLSEPLSGVTAATPTQVLEGNRIVLEYDFSEPVVSKGAEYDSVRMEGLELYERTGAPVIPVRPVTVLVPFGKKVSSVNVISSNEQNLAGTYKLAPAQKPYPLSYQGKREKTLPDPAIYGQSNPWPSLRHQDVATQSKRGYRLFVTNLFPLQYTPATGKITYAKKMQLEIRLANSGQTAVVRPSKETKSTLRKMVHNPKSLETYPAEDNSTQKLEGAATLSGGRPYQYVIITNQSLANAPGPWNFQKLVDNKTAKGMTATIVTTEWIYANYSGTRPSGGSDNQTRIRNFLIDAYQTWGTQYVLLGGTDGIVPARKLWVRSWEGKSGYIDWIPSDMYYGCVEPAACTFDFNANGDYGEPTDGVDGGDVDLYAEIYVGRAPVENTTEVANFVKKTLTYDSSISDYLPLITMAGEWLGFGGVAEYATDSMEQIRLGGSYDGYFTYGFENHIQPSFYDFDTSVNLYDSETYDWPQSELINLMNSGKHVFNHLGHANDTYCMKLYNSDLASLTNTDYFFVYSQGCDSGRFDATDCFAETITSMEHGAFAAIMNARYGWGTDFSTDGPSQRFDRQYWDAVLGEGKLEMGRANSDSKEDNLWDINGDCIRWCYYELNLFGDPQQQFRFEEACRWLTMEPQEGAVTPGNSSDVNVIFSTIDLLAGSYTAEIIITSNDPLSPTIVPVTMTVNPDDLQVAPAGNFEPNGTKGGPFTPASKTYTLENIGTTSLNWTASKTQSWLGVEPDSGSLEAGHSAEVSICVSPDANSLDPGIYTDTVIFRNTASGSIRPRSVTLTVKPPDYFTESFDADSNDLQFLSLTFSLNGTIAYYEACRERTREFYTDPDGGTFVPLGDNDFAEVVLSGGKQVLFYGQLYDRFYIGSNGYITFGQGDTKFSGTLIDHFDLPRISGLFTNLTPALEQNISYKQFDDRIAVTFKDVPLYGDATKKNSFQIEMFFVDGSIRITWLNLALQNGVVGLSEGYGLPTVFAESDLSAYPHCWPLGDFNKSYYVDFADFAVLAMHWLDEGCGIPYWCGKSDLDFSSTVDTKDLAIFADNWLAKDEWWLEPISHWKLDEGSGTIVYDSVGINNGNVYDATWTTGQIDGALSFDGINDYVDFGVIDEFEFGDSNFSTAFWFYTQGAHDLGGDQSGYGQIISKYSYYIGRQWFFQQGPEGNINFVTYPDSGSDGEELISHNGYQYQWVHCVGVREGATKRLYINGVLDNTGTTQGVITGETTKMFIGTAEVGSYKYQLFNGKIDDVRIYDRALSAQEIFELYQKGFSNKAFNPCPSDGAISVNPNVVLGWSPGYQAVSHNVYIGTSYENVNNGTGDTYKGNYDVNSYSPDGLAIRTIYYWRIDELNGVSAIKGDIWRFTTFGPPGQATNPAPADYAANVNITADLSWTAGSDTTSHDVYFGTVNPPAFQRNQTGTTFDPGTMNVNTTYYWRIDEVGPDGTTAGAVWSFTVPLPGQATNPTPADCAANVNIYAYLSWTAGFNTISHDVYFGTVNPPPFQRNQTGITFDPGTMNVSTTYYWHIDEVGPGGTTTGAVWSFTTSSIADPNFISWWKFDETSGTTASDSISINHGTLYGNPVWTTGKIGGALSFDGVNDYVLVGDKANLEPQQFTLSFWGRLNNPSGTMQGGIGKGWIFGDSTMFSYRLEFNQGNADATITNTSDTAFGCVASIGDTDWHMWSMTVGSSNVSFYKDGVLQASSAYTGTIDYTKRYNNFVIGARDGGAYYSFNGKIDDVRFYNRVLSAQEILTLYQSGQ